MAVQRTNETVPFAVLGGCDGSLGLDNRVDTTDCVSLVSSYSGISEGSPPSDEREGGGGGGRESTSVGDLSRDLEEEMVLHVSCSGGHCDFF